MSTPSGGPTDLDLLREEYGDRWDIQIVHGVYHAKRRDGEIWELPASRWAYDPASLRRKLAEFETERFTTGDLA